MKRWHLIVALVGIVVATAVGVMAIQSSIGSKFVAASNLLILPPGGTATSTDNGRSGNPYLGVSQGNAGAAQALVTATGSESFERQAGAEVGASYVFELDTVEGVTVRGGFITLEVTADSAASVRAAQVRLVSAAAETWKQLQVEAGATERSMMPLVELGTTSITSADATALRSVGGGIALAAILGAVPILVYRRQANTSRHRADQRLDDGPAEAASSGDN